MSLTRLVKRVKTCQSAYTYVIVYKRIRDDMTHLRLLKPPGEVGTLLLTSINCNPFKSPSKYLFPAAAERREYTEQKLK